jgi:O-antigen/teichoic acid export membrane protein
VTQSNRTGGFFERVAVLLFGQVLVTGISIIYGFIFARLVGPAGKGEYYLLVLVPATALVFIQLGLPSALGYYAARSQTRGILLKALVLAIGLSAVAIAVVVALYPILSETVLRGLDPVLVAAAMLSLPLLAIATFTTGILTSLKAVRWYTAVQVTQAVASVGLVIVVVGLLGYGVAGAIGIYLFAAAILMVGGVVGVRRAVRTVTSPSAVSFRELFRYGIPLYPGSITTFLSYRVDAYLIALLITDPSTALGFYSLAVTLAEMVLLVPTAVSWVLFPHVAGSERDDADRAVLVVTRVTLLATATAAIAFSPVATILVYVGLPAFTASLPAYYVLMPGAVAMSVTKTAGGYVAGLGRTGTVSAVTITAAVVNIVANVVLIPVFGIVGAALASLISYSFSSLAFTIIAARLTHARVRDFLVPTMADIAFTWGTVMAALRRVLGRPALGPDSVRG